VRSADNLTTLMCRISTSYETFNTVGFKGPVQACNVIIVPSLGLIKSDADKCMLWNYSTLTSVGCELVYLP